MEAKARGIRAALCLATAFSWLMAASPARAEGQAPVVIGEVATRVKRAKVDLPKALRRALEREIAALSLAGARRYVLSASLVRLEGRKPGAPAGVRCTVSTVLREERSGAIRAVIVGKAEADYDGEQAELGALDAAVRGAVAFVPAAMR
jgi:hypothetical protein